MSQIDFGALFRAVIFSRITWIVVACVVGLGVLLYVLSGVDSCRFQSKQDKLKNEANAKIQKVGNINAQIANLNEQKAEIKEGIKRDVEELTNSMFGHEEAKKETNKALANYLNAVNTNSNVDRSAEDILRRLEELK